MANHTAGVRQLVDDVLATMRPPFSEDIIDEVCLAIVGDPDWLQRYQELSGELREWVANNWIGRYVSDSVGRPGEHQVAARSILIESYSKLYP